MNNTISSKNVKQLIAVLVIVLIILFFAAQFRSYSSSQSLATGSGKEAESSNTNDVKSSSIHHSNQGHTNNNIITRIVYKDCPSISSTKSSFGQISLDSLPSTKQLLQFFDFDQGIQKKKKDEIRENPWKYFLSQPDDGEAFPNNNNHQQRNVMVGRSSSSNDHFAPSSSCNANVQLSKEFHFTGYKETPSSSMRTKKESSIVRFSCESTFKDHGDFAHCDPVLQQGNNNNNKQQPSSSTGSTISISVPELKQSPKLFTRSIPLNNNDEENENIQHQRQQQQSWPKNIAIGNLSLLPSPYATCRIIADTTATAMGNHNSNNNKKGSSVSSLSSPKSIREIKFKFTDSSRGPFSCQLPSDEIILDWIPPHNSKTHSRNHIVIRLASGSSSSSSSLSTCKISIQTFSLTHHKSKCQQNSAAPKENKEFLAFYPPAFYAAKGHSFSSADASSPKDILTYSIEVAGLSSLDIFASSIHGHKKQFLPSTSTLLGNDADVDTDDDRFESIDSVMLNQESPDSSKIGCSANKRMYDKQSNFFKSITKQLSTVQKTLHEPTSLLSVLRCETGPYMGYTNIIQSFVTCVVLARLCHRPILEFPLKLHHSTFDQIFDLKLVTRKLEKRFGISLKLYTPAGLGGFTNSFSVDESLIMADRPGSPRYLDQFIMFCSSRPWATVFVGDVWTSRLNVAAGDIHVEFLRDGILAPSKRVLRYAQSILDRFGYYYRSGEDDENRKNNNNDNNIKGRSGFPWVGIHMRFEDDAVNLNNKKSSSSDNSIPSSSTLSLPAQKAMKLREYIERVYPNWPVFYASGSLHSSVRNVLPLRSESIRKEISKRAENQRGYSADEKDEEKNRKNDNLKQQKLLWLNKDDFFPRYQPGTRRPWKKTYQGRYFNGKPVSVTNATGSAVDMHVLLHSPVAIVAEFSSFGEAVATARCARGLPVLMYDNSDSNMRIRQVDCEEPILFRRPLQEKIRAAVKTIHSGVVDSRDVISKKIRDDLVNWKSGPQQFS